MDTALLLNNLDKLGKSLRECGGVYAGNAGVSVVRWGEDRVHDFLHGDLRTIFKEEANHAEIVS